MIYDETENLKEESEQDPYRRDSFADEPLDRRGRAIPNRFGLKMAFSIIEIPFSIFPGILALIFTLLQNADYKKKDWESFKNFRLLSLICLVIGGVISTLTVIIISAIAIGFFYLSSDQDLMQELSSMLVTAESAETGTEADTETDPADSGTDISAYETDVARISREGIDCIIINGAELQIPADPAELLNLLNTEPVEGSESAVDAQSDVTCDTADGRYCLDFYNITDQEQDIYACTVGGLDYYPAEGDTFTFMDSLTEDSGAEEFTALLGDDYETYEIGSITEYCWYTGTGWFSVDFEEDGSIYCLSIYSYTGITE